MRGLPLVLLMCVMVSPVLGQTESLKYQPGTILAVEPHQNGSSDSTSSATQYDVSIQIDDTVYVVLYTPRAGSSTVEYSAGIERLFGVGKDSLRYPDRFGDVDLPILRTTTLPSQPGTDWSKLPGHYFSMKMKNLSTTLNLSEDQQAKIKPIADQESSEAGSVIFTPVVSRKERLEKWEKIVRSSDTKMKPILTDAQWQKLQQLRKEQKVELKELVAQLDSEDRK
jgi:Spy/CpxP family protein refolding chaperone